MNTYKLLETRTPDCGLTPVTTIVDTCIAGTLTQATRKLFRANKCPEGDATFSVVVATPRDTAVMSLVKQISPVAQSVNY